jgi:phospholipase/carboxylesterase
MMLSQLDGPRLAPASAKKATHLVVLLHGYGADGDDLIGLGQEWAPRLPHVAFVSPHAPEACGMSPMGKQWFALTFRDPHERWRGVVQAAPALNAFVDAELARHELAPDKLILAGFSQGGMLALHVGLRRAVAPAAIIGLSTMLVGPEHLKSDVITTPPLLLSHGTHDEVLPFEGMFASVNALGEAKIPCQFHISHGVGHGIDAGALHHAGEFMAAAAEWGTSGGVQ